MQRWAYTLVSPSTSQLADGQASSYSAYFLVSLHQQQVRPAWRLKGKRVKNPYSPAAVSCPWRRKHMSLNQRLGRRLLPGDKSEYLPLRALTWPLGLGLTRSVRLSQRVLPNVRFVKPCVFALKEAKARRAFLMRAP